MISWLDHFWTLLCERAIIKRDRYAKRVLFLTFTLFLLSQIAIIFYGSLEESTALWQAFSRNGLGQVAILSAVPERDNVISHRLRHVLHLGL